MLCIDHNSTKEKLEYVSKRSGVLVPYKACSIWCVELCSCQWVDSNYINCLNICLTKLIQMIKARHIPHYIIESRNMFNSKMTEKRSKEIVDVLSKYHTTTHVFTLDAFECVFELAHYNNALLKRASLTSTIMACVNACFCFFLFLCEFSNLFLVLIHTIQCHKQHVEFCEYSNKFEKQ